MAYICRTQSLEMDSSDVAAADGAQIQRENRQVLQHYKELQASLATVRSVIPDLHLDDRTKKLLEGLADIHRNADGSGEYLSARLDPTYYNECRLPNSDIAKRVFAIPELLDAILVLVDLKSLVDMCQVSRDLKTSIESSTPLQIKLGVKAMEHSETRDETYTSPFQQDIPGSRSWQDSNGASERPTLKRISKSRASEGSFLESVRHGGACSYATAYQSDDRVSGLPRSPQERSTGSMGHFRRGIDGGRSV